MLPKNERIIVSPDQNGSLSQIVSERNYTAVVNELDHRILLVSFTSKRDVWDYQFPLAMGVALGISVMA